LSEVETAIWPAHADMPYGDDVNLNLSLSITMYEVC
jgi:hypothetical protein